MEDFIAGLSRAGQIVTVKREVNPRFELAAVTHAIQQQGNEAVLFENVAGARFPVVSNLYGSPERIARILHAEPRDFCHAWARILAAGSPPADSPPGPRPSPDPDAIWQRGKLGDLPLPWYSEGDGGPYLTGGIFLARDPEQGVPNLSFHRAMYVADDELRVRLAPGHDLTAYHQRAESLGQPLEAAILIGTSPEIFLAAAARLPRQASELELARRLGAKAGLRKCQRINLDIPADTQIVIEGRFLPHERRPEGPFGEFMGYYVPVADNAVFEVADVTWRHGALFHSINCGSAEELLPLGLLTAATTFAYFSSRLPGVLDVAFHPIMNLTVIKFDQQYAGQAAAIASAALDDPVRARICAVVDPDIDIYDLRDVLWALLTRADGVQDVLTAPGRRSFFRDPQAAWGRFAIDACSPPDQRTAFRRKAIPGASGIRLSDYVSQYGPAF